MASSQNQVVKRIDDVHNMVEELFQQSRDNLITVTKLEIKVSSMDEKVSKISEIVATGNGQPSLVARLAVVEEKVRDQEHDEKSEKAQRFDKWMLYVALFTALASIAAQVVL